MSTNQFPLSVSHVADSYMRFPGETVTFQTRIILFEDVNSYALTVTIPKGLAVKQYSASDSGTIASFAHEDGDVVLEWTERGALTAGRCMNYTVAATVDDDQLVWHEPSSSWGEATFPSQNGNDAPLVVQDRLQLESKASIVFGKNQSNTQSGGLHQETKQYLDETIPITIIAKGNYLQYLPSLYEQDDFMGRFLMLFESFWGPLEEQLGEIHRYQDPTLTSESMLPWLASWFDMTLGSGWSATEQRAVLESIMGLYSQRSTKTGLKNYLERFSGGTVEITEFSADSFRIGKDAQLGSGIAFGSNKSPNTFSVYVMSPRLTERCEGPISGLERQKRIERLEILLAQIIEAEKPAHTVCTSLTID